MAMPDFQLSRNSFGRLVLVDADGQKHDGVTPVHAFPISAPAEGVALVDRDGRELVWIDRLADLPVEIGSLVQEELANREFIPAIGRICRVSTFSTPSIWEVETDRGPTSFVLKGEDDIRRLSSSSLLIADSHGINYLVPDIGALDHASRKLLDRFL